jgi:ABC-2 type transport system permease protein
LLLSIGDDVQLIYPESTLSEADLRTELESALKRAAPGFLKTVGLWLPDLQPQQDYLGQMVPPISSWNLLQQQLGQDYTLRQVDLSGGRVPGDIDALVVVAPQGMTEEERFAIDQYLMRGGSVVAAAGNFVLPTQQFPGGLYVEQVSAGLQELLTSYGVTVQESMVLDPQNEPFPVQVQRQVGGMQVVELQELSYPPFVDVRSDGMEEESVIVSSLPAVTMHWVSPLTVDEVKNEGRQVDILLQSTEGAWLRSEIDMQPKPELYPEYGFVVEGEQQSWPLAVAIRGSFESFYADRASPFEAGDQVTGTVEGPVGTIKASPESARLVVIGSAEFIDDAILELSRSLSADRYLNNLQFMQNAVDWSVEDEDLLTIRSRGTYARLLKPLEREEQSLWEGLNYALVLVALIVIGGVWTLRRRSEQPMPIFERVQGTGPETFEAIDPEGEASNQEGGSDE